MECVLTKTVPSLPRNCSPLEPHTLACSTSPWQPIVIQFFKRTAGEIGRLDCKPVAQAKEKTDCQPLEGNVWSIDEAELLTTEENGS